MNYRAGQVVGVMYLPVLHTIELWPIVLSKWEIETFKFIYCHKFHGYWIESIIIAPLIEVSNHYTN